MTRRVLLETAPSAVSHEELQAQGHFCGFEMRAKTLAKNAVTY
jgi:hypothetical protein